LALAGDSTMTKDLPLALPPSLSPLIFFAFALVLAAGFGFAVVLLAEAFVFAVALGLAFAVVLLLAGLAAVLAIGWRVLILESLNRIEMMFGGASVLF
jgi:hypothetical protein